VVAPCPACTNLVGSLGRAHGDSREIDASLLPVHARLRGLVPHHDPLRHHRHSQCSRKLELDSKSILYGCAVRFSGAMGQLLLFWVLTKGPAYIIFPIICLSPVVTIILSATLLKERTYPLALTGIILSIPAILFLSLQEPTNSPVHGYTWLLVTLAIFFAWGLQAYFMKSSANSISSTGLALGPIALWMTDFSAAINWSLSGPYLTADPESQLPGMPALRIRRALRQGHHCRSHGQRSVSSRDHCALSAHLPADPHSVQFRRHGAGSHCHISNGLR
jgi:EamA-like transporter family